MGKCECVVKRDCGNIPPLPEGGGGERALELTLLPKGVTPRKRLTLTNVLKSKLSETHKAQKVWRIGVHGQAVQHSKENKKLVNMSSA